MNEKLVEKAYKYAEKQHDGVKRKKVDEPNFMHPIRVSEYVKKYKGNSKNIDILVASALLHDTIEDTDTTLSNIRRLFGSEVAEIVHQLTTNNNMRREMGKTNYLKYKLEEMSSYALTVKLCDRLDNVSDLSISTPKSRTTYLTQTSEILDYLQKNRTLKKEQKYIINDIYDCLLEVEDIYKNDEQFNELFGNIKNNLFN